MDTKTLARVVVGSRLQGLALPDSDTDVRRVWIAPIDSILSPWPVPAPNLDDAEDGWELRHFVSLLVKANPTVLEVLHSEIYLTDPLPTWTSLRGIVPNLLDPPTIVRSFTGYVMSAKAAIGGIPDALRQGAPIAEAPRARKHAVTALRVARQGATLLETGRFQATVPDDDRTLSMSIRREGLSGGRTEAWRSRLVEAMTDLQAGATSPHPSLGIDRAAVAAFLTRAYGITGQ